MSNYGALPGNRSIHLWKWIKRLRFPQRETARQCTDIIHCIFSTKQGHSAMKHKLNPENERIKRIYVHYLKNADGKADASIRQVEKAIRRFEDYTRAADFKTFDQKQAVGFKEDLASQEIALATVNSTINMLKRFLGWLALQPGHKTRVRHNDIAYLSLPEKDVRAAQAPAAKSVPTLAMIESAVRHMPHQTPIEKRNRALIALAAMTAIRVGALVTLKLKHFDQARMLVLQDPSEVSTKFRKRIDTFLCPFSNELETIFLDWVRYLKEVLLFTAEDPLFPKTEVAQDGNNCFSATGLTREHWTVTSPVRTILSCAFVKAGLPSHTPHKFRNMLVNEGYDRNLSVAEMKALSQNLGHESAMTTLTSYGKIATEQQGRLIRGISTAQDEKPLTRSQLKEILDGLGFEKTGG